MKGRNRAMTQRLVQLCLGLCLGVSLGLAGCKDKEAERAVTLSGRYGPEASKGYLYRHSGDDLPALRTYYKFLAIHEAELYPNDYEQGEHGPAQDERLSVLNCALWRNLSDAGDQILKELKAYRRDVYADLRTCLERQGGGGPVKNEDAKLCHAQQALPACYFQVAPKTGMRSN